MPPPRDAVGRFLPGPPPAPRPPKVAGRPPKPGARSERVNVRLTPTEFDTLCRLAAAQRATFGAVLRAGVRHLVRVANAAGRLDGGGD